MTALLLAACATPAAPSADGGGSASGPAASTSGRAPGPSGGAGNGDPNAAGRASAAATASGTPGSDGAGPGSAAGGAAGGGATAICANETLGESMTRAVDGGSSIVLATGRFTGRTDQADGEIAVPYSEVALEQVHTLAGPAVASTLTAWVYGDLAASGDGALTGETSSLWASGGRLIAVVDTQVEWSGLAGPVIRVTPVVGDKVVLSWVGCWSTNGVPAGDYDGAVAIFDDRGLQPTELQLSAVSLDDFTAVLPG